MTLSGNNSGFQAGINLNNGANGLGTMGALVIGSTTALGTGFLTLTSGNLLTTVSGGVTLANQLLGGATANNVITFTGNNPITFSNSLATYDLLQASLSTRLLGRSRYVQRDALRVQVVSR